MSARVSDGPRALPELLRAADHAGIASATAQVHRPTLDDVFLTLTGRSLREAEDRHHPYHSEGSSMNERQLSGTHRPDAGILRGTSGVLA